MKKYDTLGPFTDPVVRCDSCQALLKRNSVQKTGMCSKCGSRRIRNLSVCDEKEMAQMKEWEIDPDFLALFGEVNE